MQQKVKPHPRPQPPQPPLTEDRLLEILSKWQCFSFTNIPPSLSQADPTLIRQFADTLAAKGLISIENDLMIIAKQKPQLSPSQRQLREILKRSGALNVRNLPISLKAWSQAQVLAVAGELVELGYDIRIDFQERWISLPGREPTGGIR